MIDVKLVIVEVADDIDEAQLEQAFVAGRRNRSAADAFEFVISDDIRRLPLPVDGRGSFLEIDRVALCSPDARWRHAQGSGSCPSCVAFKRNCALEVVARARRLRKAAEFAHRATVPWGP